MEKLFIKNIKGQKLAVLLDLVSKQNGLAFVMHGLGGFKEEPHIQVMADAFLAHGISVVRFDATNTYGESEGDYADATVTNYYEDLEDVIRSAAGRKWYEEPFILAGHSLGGICVTLFAEKYPGKVRALAPISTVVSGTLSVSTKPEEFAEWRRIGWQERESGSTPGLIKRLKWSHMEDRLKYDVVPQASKLTMPVLLIVGEKDELTPPRHQKILYEALPESDKEFHIIKDSPHTFREPAHLAELKNIFNHWLEKNVKV